jgi:PAS domain-containing protein
MASTPVIHGRGDARVSGGDAAYPLTGRDHLSAVARSPAVASAAGDSTLKHMPANESWTRHLAQLHARAERAGARAPADPLGRLATETLSACADILDRLGRVEIECERLRDDKVAAVDAYSRLFEGMPTPALVTDRAGVILRANRAASAWLNLAVKRLEGRQLLLYAEDRSAFMRLLGNLPREGAIERLPVNLRPRERRAIAAIATVTPLSMHDTGRWIWIFEMRAAGSPRAVVCGGPVLADGSGPCEDVAADDTH